MCIRDRVSTPQVAGCFLFGIILSWRYIGSREYYKLLDLDVHMWVSTENRIKYADFGIKSTDYYTKIT